MTQQQKRIKWILLASFTAYFTYAIIVFTYTNASGQVAFDPSSLPLTTKEIEERINLKAMFGPLGPEDKELCDTLLNRTDASAESRVNCLMLNATNTTGNEGNEGS